MLLLLLLAAPHQRRPCHLQAEQQARCSCHRRSPPCPWCGSWGRRRGLAWQLQPAGPWRGTAGGRPEGSQAHHRGSGCPQSHTPCSGCHGCHLRCCCPHPRCQSQSCPPLCLCGRGALPWREESLRESALRAGALREASCFYGGKSWKHGMGQAWSERERQHVVELAWKAKKSLALQKNSSLCHITVMNRSPLPSAHTSGEKIIEKIIALLLAPTPCPLPTLTHPPHSLLFPFSALPPPLPQV